MSGVPEAHRASAGQSPVLCAIITCSDTRTEADDRSGARMRQLLEEAGHEIVFYKITKEDPGDVLVQLHEAAKTAQVILLNGGTGVSVRDSTPEAVLAFVDKQLPGFGELFRVLSYQDIGAAAMLSRAIAGTRDKVAVFASPGSTAAVELAMRKLILPELRHIVGLLRP
ncbi:MAG: molybdenum cofactor biosynthesis protein B [Rhodothermales bacterium]|jgi:molybdenum cofactor biosynthesis protein B